MKNYFLVLGRDRRKLLEEALIAFSEMNVLADDSFSNVDGIVIAEEDLNRTLEVLHASVTAEKITSYDGVYRVYLLFQVPGKKKYQQPLPVFNVRTNGIWEGRGRQAFEETTKEVLLPHLKKDCFLSVPHGSVNRLSRDGNFHIFFYSAVDRKGTGDPPATLWGIPNYNRRTAYLPTGDGIPFCTDEGWVIAELIGDNLYIHHDLCDSGSDDDLKIYRRLLEEVVAELTMNSEQKEERDRKRAAEMLERTRQEYITLCGKRLGKNIDETRKNIEYGTREVSDLQAKVVRKIREVKGAQLKLEQLQSVSAGVTSSYVAEFDKLAQVPKITKITIAENKINVFTETLYCVNSRTNINHEIGRFRIEINTDGREDGIRWFNLDRRVQEMNAPHVYGEGNACLGNAQEIFPELIGNYEFAAAAMVAIQFVESANVDDPAGAKIKYWPVAEKQVMATTA